MVCKCVCVSVNDVRCTYVARIGQKESNLLMRFGWFRMQLEIKRLHVCSQHGISRCICITPLILLVLLLFGECGGLSLFLLLFCSCVCVFFFLVVWLYICVLARAEVFADAQINEFQRAVYIYMCDVHSAHTYINFDHAKWQCCTFFVSSMKHHQPHQMYMEWHTWFEVITAHCSFDQHPRAPIYVQ